MRTAPARSILLTLAIVVIAIIILVLLFSPKQNSGPSNIGEGLLAGRSYPGCGKSLQDCIANFANTGDTIIIAPGLYTESLTLDKPVSLTANLPGAFIHARPNDRVMTVTGAINNGVVISGLTLFGGALNTSFEPAAGVWITGNASIQIINSTIASNTNAAGSGGGLYVAAGASLDLIHSRIFNNSATFFSQADGGGIWVGGVVNLTGDSFSLNTADQNGGNIYADRNATLVVSGTQVLNGKAMRGGGLLAFFIDNLSNQPPSGHLTIDNSIFSGNTGGNGGAIGLYPSENIAIRHTQIVSNTASTWGGGIFLGSSVPGFSLDLSGSLIGSNTSVQSDGGGINAGSVSITGGSIIGNSALDTTFGGGHGGGIFSSGQLTLTAMLIQSNTAQYGGGLFGSTPLVFSQVQIDDNSAMHQGGGLYLNGGTSALQVADGVTIVNNSSAGSTPEGGGGLYVNNGVLEMNGGLIAN